MPEKAESRRETIALPAALVGSRYSRLVMMHSGHRRLLEPSGRLRPECRHSSIPGSACPAFLRLAPRDRATARYRHRTQRARIAQRYNPKTPPATMPSRAISMIGFSSLGSLFETWINGSSIHQIWFTQNRCCSDSAICPNRKRARLSRNRHVVARAGSSPHPARGDCVFRCRVFATVDAGAEVSIA
jgi:hypothetical protein